MWPLPDIRVTALRLRETQPAEAWASNLRLIVVHAWRLANLDVHPRVAGQGTPSTLSAAVLVPVLSATKKTTSVDGSGL